MNPKTLKMQRDLKSKLMAAISMLLVSSILLVTSTYAWFTLSTAPEVTGITTAVGANGNLEMALLNPELQGEDGKLISNWGDAIQAGTSDSMDAAGTTISEANITWGNLVDLSKTYGLEMITLYPSELKITEDSNEISANPLSRPVFGADGRIAELKADTITASYASNKFSNENAFGVRAVGTSSSMTARELAHRAAITSASTAASQAKTAASTALNENGNVLAAIAITHAGSDTATFTKTQVETLKTVIEALKASHTHIENAMKWYVVANSIAPTTINDDTYDAIQQKIIGMSLAEISESDDTEILKPSNFSEVYGALTTSEEKVTTALGTLNVLLEDTSKSSYVWGEFNSALSAVMDYDEMAVNGVAIKELTTKDEAGNYVNMGAITGNLNNGLELQMPTGSGVFADIADFCGTYTATIVFPDGTTVMGLPIGGMKASMATNNPINPTHLSAMRTNTSEFGAADGVESTKSITDYYGYIVDLAFRTNAADSKLLLQAEAVDRIYSESSSNEETMGGGSSMTFTASDEFGVTRVVALMSSLRIVFFETDTNEIIGEARLDSSKPDIVGNKVTMKMAMWDATAGAFKVNDAITENIDESKIITDLAQNEAKAISVLVYLDGNSVTNADVATSGATSMTGSMNLQFASSATLVPMEYADLRDGKSSVDVESDSTITMTNVLVNSTSVNLIKAVGTNGTGFAVVLNGVEEGATVTATIGESTITGVKTTVDNVDGYTFAYTGELTADTAVEIFVTSGEVTPTT